MSGWRLPSERVSWVKASVPIQGKGPIWFWSTRYGPIAQEGVEGMVADVQRKLDYHKVPLAAVEWTGATKNPVTSTNAHS